MESALGLPVLVALIAVFTVWSQVGGQSHLDYMAWQAKLVLGCGVAFAAVKATAAAVAGERAWNGKTLRWIGILFALVVGCGLASYYVHEYVEPADDDQQQDESSTLIVPRGGPGRLTPPSQRSFPAPRRLV